MSIHIPVLLEESIEGLKLKKGDTVVDATLGGGGHTQEILKRIMPGGKLIAFDQDNKAIENFKSQISDDESGEGIELINRNFTELENTLEEQNIKKVDAVLADFGISSDQLADDERGMSFMTEMRLDMRMNQSQKLDAETVVNAYDQQRLERILQEYGDERFARRIAENIVRQRKNKRIETTAELENIVRSSIPMKFQPRRINPATKTFQAIRIEVNQEFENIRKFLPQAISALHSGGRLAVITFHSGEDRIAKDVFREYARGCICPPNIPICQCGKSPIIKRITKKPIVSGQEELEKNPRARSAKLRIIEKI